MISNLWDALENASTVVEMLISDASGAVLDQAQRAEMGHGTVVRRVRGRFMRTQDQLFAEMSAALQFPTYFGFNWAAFDECLSDLDWLFPDSGVLLIVEGVDEVLVDASEKDRQTFGECIRRATYELQSPTESWDERTAINFRLVGTITADSNPPH